MAVNCLTALFSLFALLKGDTMTFFRNTLRFCWAILSLLLLETDAFAAPIWFRTVEGTVVLNPYPQPNESCSWSGGRDEQGFATGAGILMWSINGEPVEATVGTMRQGRFQGQAIQMTQDGSASVAEFRNGLPVEQTRNLPSHQQRQPQYQQPRQSDQQARNPSHASRPPAADPMPRPNYVWLHGQRYTPIAFLQLQQWYARQKHFTKEQKDHWIDFWWDQNAKDHERERQWIKSTFSNPYSK